MSAFFPRETEVLSAEQVQRAIVRISHEIVERHGQTGVDGVDGLDGLVIVGMQTGGTWIAERLVSHIAEITAGTRLPLGALDVSMYRDDIALRPVVPTAPSQIPVDLTGRTVVLVDDVLFTGRTVRAALEALNDHGRPRAVQLAVMVDRGHRELPIRPDFVGKNIPTHVSDEVDVSAAGVVVRTGRNTAEEARAERGGEVNV